MNLELLLAFALMTGLTSVVPGPSMLFVMTESIWRGPRAGWVALLGMQVGYLFWWALAAFGLGSLARLYPLAFDILALGGIAYIGWLGVQALLHAGEGAGKSESEARKPSRHAFRDGMAVAIGNPKALVYVVALLPPFVDATRPILPQLAVLTVVGTVIDLAVGGVLHSRRQSACPNDDPTGDLHQDRPRRRCGVHPHCTGNRGGTPAGVSMFFTRS